MVVVLGTASSKRKTMLPTKKIICTTCNGTGWTRWEYEPHGCSPVETSGVNCCPTCNGTKKMKNPDYHQIRKILERITLQTDMRIFNIISPLLPPTPNIDIKENKKYKHIWPMFGIKA